MLSGSKAEHLTLLHDWGHYPDALPCIATASFRRAHDALWPPSHRLQSGPLLGVTQALPVDPYCRYSTSQLLSTVRKLVNIQLTNHRTFLSQLPSPNTRQYAHPWPRSRRDVGCDAMPTMTVSLQTWSCMPFLYPCLARRPIYALSRGTACVRRPTAAANCHVIQSRSAADLARHQPVEQRPDGTIHEDGLASGNSHLNPKASEYYSTNFTDKCTLTVHAGAGGHGCVSFLREMFIAEGPANGGDGGTGGSIYIQAVRGETSLHKLSRQSIMRAGRGRNGQGKGRGGERGKDVLIQVPVGTIVREIDRHDPFVEATEEYRRSKRMGADKNLEAGPDAPPDQLHKWRRDKWLLYPGLMPSAYARTEFPALPRPRKSNLTMTQPKAPIRLDLDKPMERPILLAAGAMGGLGNPHFVTKDIRKPKFATKGSDPMHVVIELELKILADVGLVGMPNAGKSTLLRSISNSRTRVGNWEFTTLQPNIGTVVVDDHRGRPDLPSRAYAGDRDEPPRTSFTVADIPGLIEGAHLDKGLGLGFLRHIERAAVLAFVVDLSKGDAVAGLKALWNEITQYQALRDKDTNTDSERRHFLQTQLVGGNPVADTPRLSSGSHGAEDDHRYPSQSPPGLLSSKPDDPHARDDVMRPIAAKPWLVIATKADLENTQPNFEKLQAYVRDVGAGKELHPSGLQNAWRREVVAVPVSAINAEGTSSIPAMMMRLIDE